MTHDEITSVEEFRRLRLSVDPDEYRRSAWARAADAVWLEIIDLWPEMRCWVAHNRTISVSIIERLAADPDPSVRGRIAMKRRLPGHVRSALLQDSDEAVAANARRHGSI